VISAGFIIRISIMGDEPLFDPSLKKRSKKKQVAFSEDPLGADADPTTPAPAIIDNHTTNGDAVDMGPTTMHEQMMQNGATDGDAQADDFKAMFGDLKKKKKKKEIPLDLVGHFFSLISPDFSCCSDRGQLRDVHTFSSCSSGRPRFF
jgi:translation initiation factor 2 subunit 2